MILTPQKCHFATFASKHENQDFVYKETLLHCSSPEKLLGITIDENLNFNDHINHICIFAGRQLNALSRISYMLSDNQKKFLFNLFIQGQFNYCPLVWMFSSRTSNDKINKLQERFLRLYFDYYAPSYDDLLRESDDVTIHIRNIQ